MNRFFFTITYVLFISCENNAVKKVVPGDSHKVMLQLTDSLGVITFNNPVRYDTSFSWVHYSDCNTCHEQKYRFQSKKNPIVMESGWFAENNDQVPDDKFTISHKSYHPFHESDTAKDFVSHKHFKENLLYTKSMAIIFDTIYKINDRYFSYFEMENKDSLYRKEVLAISTINGKLISFQCQLISRGDDSITRNFFKSSFGLINSIKCRDKL